MYESLSFFQKQWLINAKSLNLFGRSVQLAIIFGIFEKNNFHWVSVIRGLYLGRLFTEMTHPPENAAIFFLMQWFWFRSACKRTKYVNKQHLKFINRCNNLPQTHKKLLLKLFIDTKSYRQIYCLVHNGQLISKCLFGIFTFFQKTNENKSTSKVITTYSCNSIKRLVR